MTPSTSRRQKSALPFLFSSLFLLLPSVSALTSMDANCWAPDTVVTKHDPYALISSNFGQPDGEYNFNTNPFTLMGREPSTCNGCTASGKHVIVENLKLYVNDTEFFIQAICYNPVPLGQYYMDPTTGYNGTGYCSANEDAYGEYKSACFDSDYFSGTPASSLRSPAGPPGGWFEAIWMRDFPVIKALGVNTLRLYNADPTTLQYSEAVLNGQINDPSIVAPMGKDHTLFMDKAWAAGFYVIFPLVGDLNLLTNNNMTQLEQMQRNLIDEVGNHPSLLMWGLGNELDTYDDANLRAQVNYLIDFSRNYTYTKWGRKIPVTSAVVDNPPSYDTLFADLNVDVFSANAGYRGISLTNLYSGDPSVGFSGFQALSAQYGKPSFIAEIGWRQINGSVTANIPGWFNQMWASVINHTSNGCIGGAFFEYSDEPLKADPQQQTMGAVSFQVTVVNPALSTGYPGSGQFSTTGEPITQYTGAVSVLTSGGSGSETGTNAGDTGSTKYQASSASVTGFSLAAFSALFALVLLV